MRGLNYCRIGLPFLVVLVVLPLLLAMAWAKKDGPFRQIGFSLTTPHGGKTKAIAVLPKPRARFPVVIFVQGAGDNLKSIGKSLRRIAELGLAAVGIEYDQTNQSVFDEQFAALQNFVRRQPWAQSNAVAWVGMGLGAQRTLRFILNHPEVHPQLLVRLSGGWNDELATKFQVPNSRLQDKRVQSSNRFPRVLIHTRVLLVHSDNDTVFPLEDTRRLAALLETNGVQVTLRVLPGVGHDFGDDYALVIRETAEYCRAHLPPADYTATLHDCRLNEAERRRFNLAMQRAGRHRRELWKAVVSSREPERHTVMMVIGGLEDYDLAHMTASYLKQDAHMAWQARRKYPWCRNVPLDIFEKFVAGPRFFQEPIQRWRPYLNQLIRDDIKYCHTTAEVSDRIWTVMNKMVTWGKRESGGSLAPMDILNSGESGCLGLCILHSAFARSVGLPERVTRVLWQNSLGEHYCTEVWSTEDQRWHEIDGSAGSRPFAFDWIMRVPKTAILAPTGDRGLWNGLSVGRWDTFTNTIGMVYPSGKVIIKVLDHGAPAPDRTVGIELPTVKGLIYMALARTDLSGEARLTLGRSARYPYLFFVLPPDEAAASAKYPYPFLLHHFGEEIWQWVQVRSGRTQEVILNLEDRRPFDPDMKPPALTNRTTLK